MTDGFNCRLNVGVPDVFRWSLGDSVNEQPDMGWRGIVALNYAEGWIEIDTRYRWTREERRSIAGFFGRIFG